MVMAMRVALVLLFVAVVAGQITVVRAGQSMAEAYPEFADLQAPLVSAALAFGVCVEVTLVITGVLVGYLGDERIFGSSSLRLVDALGCTLAVATAIVVSTLFLIPGPPALGLLVLGGALVGATFTLVVLVFRSLLRKAAFTRAGLGEVV